MGEMTPDEPPDESTDTWGEDFWLLPPIKIQY